MSSKPLVLSVDAMGGDNAPYEIIKGVSFFLQRQPNVEVILHGILDEIEPILEKYPLAKKCKIVGASSAVPMDIKPAQAMRKKDTSMWNAIASVKEGAANAAVSAGSTGALMAVAHLQLRTVPGLHRPAIAAEWPNPRNTKSVVLDIGANVDSDPDQLVDFAIMGEAYAKAVMGIARPSVGLLNVGSEEVKGHEDIREAMRLLRLHGESLGMNVHGFVEGNDISNGTTDVVVTDGFTGNIALKAAEGAAKLLAALLKDALKSSPINMLGALIASDALAQLKAKMDPRGQNGGIFLGLNGIVVKSHGGTDAKGFASAMNVALKLCTSDIQNDIAVNLQRLVELRQQKTLSKEAVEN